jgi:hypothetical protein
MTDLHPLAAQIRTRINANERAMRSLDRVDGFRLERLTDQLRGKLAHLEADMKRPLEGPYGTKGRWGPNGHLPAINDLIRQSAAICERVAIQEVWAA